MTDVRQALAAWLTEHTAELRAQGIVCDLGSSPDDGRSKTSACLTLESKTRLAAITVWDSGEAELDYADVAHEQAHSEHRDLRTSRDLATAMTALVEWLGLRAG
uniref:Uncharacterized protein n=1 Tax=Streptomyces sp. NBC_00049 TaxID=2903617 RepID=A0AAU2JYG9_9ACTN